MTIGETMRRFSGVLAILAIALVMVPLPASAAAILVVDADGLASASSCNDATPTYPNITLAIAAANAGDTVKVCPGTYPESTFPGQPLHVDKTLTLLGAQAGVDARAPRGPESIVTNPQGTWLDADNIVIDGFTIQDSTVNAFTGYGIWMGGKSGTQVLNTIFQDNIIGLGLSNQPGGSQVLIKRNLFQNNNNTGSASGTGIYSDQFEAKGSVDNVLITENAFKGNVDSGVDISHTDTTQAFSNLEISHNSFDQNGRGIVLFDTDETSIHDNSITNSTFIDSAAIRMFDANSNLSIMHNDLITGAGRGIRISDIDAVDPGTPNPSSNVVINYNNIEVFADEGLLVSPDGHVGTVDAECNWWNSSTGPYNDPNNTGGTGEEVAGDADFLPWLLAPTPPDEPCTGGTKLKPTIATTLSESAGIRGDKVHDSAKLTGATSDAGGTVDYRYYTDPGGQAACEADTAGTGGTDVGTVTVAGGLVPDSPNATFNTAGTFYWAAFYSGDAKNEAAKSGCGTERLVIATQVAKIAPTGTTCQQYQNGTAATLGQVLYTVTKGKIGAVSPGVFFYYTRVSGPGTVTITQSHTGSAPTIPIQMKQVLLYSDPGCATLKWSSLTVNPDGTATGTLPSAGNFIISVKYDSGSLKGKDVPLPSTSTYTFGTNGIAADIARVDLAKK
jgi:parallel beta-helix repeat protein